MFISLLAFSESPHAKEQMKPPQNVAHQIDECVRKQFVPLADPLLAFLMGVSFSPKKGGQLRTSQ